MYKMKKDSQMIGWREFGGTNPFYPRIILGVYNSVNGPQQTNSGKLPILTL